MLTVLLLFFSDFISLQKYFSVDKCAAVQLYSCTNTVHKFCILSFVHSSTLATTSHLFVLLSQLLTSFFSLQISVFSFSLHICFVQFFFTSEFQLFWFCFSGLGSRPVTKSKMYKPYKVTEVYQHPMMLKGLRF